MSTLALAAFAGCEIPKEPGDWSWDTQLYVPLGARTYGLWDLAGTPADTLRRRGSGIGMTADSSLYFLGYREMQVSFRDSIYMEPESLAAYRPLTAVQVPVNLDRTDTLTLGSLNPDVAAQHGMVVTLPSHPLHDTTFIDFGYRVNTMRVDTGSVLITVTNTLAYSVGGLDVVLHNRLGEEHALIAGATLAPGGQVEQRVSLAAIRLLRSALIDVSAMGEGGSAVEIDSTRGLMLHVRVDVLQAGQYDGIIAPQILTADSSSAIDMRHRLHLGIIDEGTLTITVSNQTQLDDTVWIVFPSVMTQSGDTLISKQFVPSYSERSATLNLRNHTMRLAPTSPQHIAVRLRSLTTETAGPVTFSGGSQYVQGQVTTSRIGFSYFEGIVDSLTLTFPPQGVRVEQPPPGWEGVHPTSVSAFLHIFESIGARSTTEITVQTLRSGSPIASTTLTAPDVDMGSDTTLVFEGLGALTAQYPDSIVTFGITTISGGVALYETQGIFMDVELRAPLEFVLSPIDAPGEVQRVATESVEDIQGGSARVRIWNRLPVAGSAYLVAAKDSVDVLESSTAGVDTLGWVTIPAPVVIGGRATGESYAEVTIDLSGRLLELFRQPPFYTRTHIHLPGSNGDTLIAHGTDYIRVQVIAELVYRVRTGGGN